MPRRPPLLHPATLLCSTPPPFLYVAAIFLAMPAHPRKQPRQTFTTLRFDIYGHSVLLDDWAPRGWCTKI